MKKFLLLGAMALIVASASAATPLKRSDAKLSAKSQMQRMAMPNVQVQSNTMRVDGMPVVNKAPNKKAYLEPFYKRPAGAFYVDYLSVDGDYGYAYSAPFLFLKPFTDYTYQGSIMGADENTHSAWDIFIYGPEEGFIAVDDAMEVTASYIMETDETPIFYAVDGPLEDTSSDWYTYRMFDHEMGGSSTKPVVESETPVNVFSLPSDKVMHDDGSEVDYWASSKSMVGGGRNGDQYYTMTAYYGAEPYGSNEYGWWFGKNGGHIDGMAQAFEKPTSPYLLKKVGFRIASDAVITDNVKLTCKVYKLDEIPAYNDTTSVGFPEVPGELIVSGEATLSAATLSDNYGFMEFTLFGADEDDPELTYEYMPTIDCPILITIEGYNDIDELVDFTTYISADYNVDEGYGELAYLKYPINEIMYDENGDTIFDDNGQPELYFTGDYYWRGLNNFFQSGTMMTSFAIYISTENPFVTFNYTIEDGKHTFPNEGGSLIKDVEVDGEIYQIEGIDFFAWASADDWVLTYNGTDELPDWLEINLEDVEGDENSGYEVYADVTAQPLPENVKYREAIVRFEIPGDYIEYKFMQGEPGVYGDVDGNGEVNIVDVNIVINCILSGKYLENADVDGNGEINIGDINAIIGVILK